MTTLAGGMISDGSYRYHLAGENLGRMAQLGTFADEMVCHENSVVRIEPWSNMKAAALISCGISTGFGSAVDRGKVKPGETVVVVGCGGVGSGAIQGARIAGARTIIAVDPVAFKQQKALEVGATHVAASMLDAQFMLPELTMGRNADVVILTPGVLKGEMIADACQLGSKDARIVVTSISPFAAMDVKLNLFNFAMFNQSLLGTVFGSVSPRVQVPNLLNLYASGQLKLDEIITQEYTLDQVQQGYEDQAAGTIVRGVVKFDA
jgi:S-(hydroxymethyl)glutathione dehydrogenase/alcohol dehydrogenase